MFARPRFYFLRIKQKGKKEIICFFFQKRAQNFFFFLSSCFFFKNIFLFFKKNFTFFLKELHFFFKKVSFFQKELSFFFLRTKKLCFFLFVSTLNSLRLSFFSLLFRLSCVSECFLNVLGSFSSKKRKTSKKLHDQKVLNIKWHRYRAPQGHLTIKLAHFRAKKGTFLARKGKKWAIESAIGQIQLRWFLSRDFFKNPATGPAGFFD